MYYKAQGICDSEEEFLLMKEAFQAPLPVAIKVNTTSSSTHGSVTETLQKLAQLDDSKPEKCENLSWALDGNSWQWGDISRVHVRKDPALIRLKQWLVDHEQIGTLTRQEAVSMIPPIALGVQPGDTVLDMCAAPGSKTCQLLEMVGEAGAVVANDVEWKRANMLAHQVQRLCSPSSVVCNADASSFPSSGALFSKVLCDVPCTGDGTIRKAQDIWRRWTISDGLGIHTRQLQILCRGLNMLKPGGHLVYSTCSLNPIENEAVVNAALDKFKGKVRLVPMDNLPGMKFKDGLSTWKVFDDKTKQEVTEVSNQGKLRVSMFPSSLNLALCRRYLPHLMNTGGFFVAKLERVDEEAVSLDKSEKSEKKHAIAEFAPITPELYANITSFYGIDQSLVTNGQLFMHKQHDKHIYFVSKSVSAYITSCPSSLSLVSIGVRAFADLGKWESSCPFRVTQEGVAALRNFFIPNSPRVSYMPEHLFLELLEKREFRNDVGGFMSPFADKGCAIVFLENSVAMYGGSIGLAVMASKEIVQVYADKLYCGWLGNIMHKVNDPLGV